MGCRSPAEATAEWALAWEAGSSEACDRLMDFSWIIRYQ